MGGNDRRARPWRRVPWFTADEDPQPTGRSRAQIPEVQGALTRWSCKEHLPRFCLNPFRPPWPQLFTGRTETISEPRTLKWGLQTVWLLVRSHPQVVDLVTGESKLFPLGAKIKWKDTVCRSILALIGGDPALSGRASPDPFWPPVSPVTWITRSLMPQGRQASWVWEGLVPLTCGDPSAASLMAERLCLPPFPPSGRPLFPSEAQRLSWAHLSHWLGEAQRMHHHRCGCKASPFLSNTKNYVILTCDFKKDTYEVTTHAPTFVIWSWNEVKVLAARACPTLYLPMDFSSPASSVQGVLQARTLDWVAIPFSRRSSWPRDQTQVSRIAGRFFTVWATREAPL